MCVYTCMCVCMCACVFAISICVHVTMQHVTMLQCHNAVHVTICHITAHITMSHVTMSQCHITAHVTMSRHNAAMSRHNASDIASYATCHHIYCELKFYSFVHVLKHCVLVYYVALCVEMYLFVYLPPSCRCLKMMLWLGKRG